jgi:serine/threonine-protein kinase
MTYEMLCGQPAFVGGSIPEVVFKVVYEDPPPLAPRVPGLSDQLAAVIHRAMAKKPEERFNNVDEFVEALTGDKLSSHRGAALISRPPGSRARTGSGGGASGSESGKRKVTSDDALANTVGSDPHGTSPIAVAETVASASRPAIDTGSVASAIAKADATASAAAAAAEVAPESPPAKPPAARRSRVAWIAAGGIAIAIGGVIAGVVIAGRDDDDRVAATTADAAPVVAMADAPTLPATVDAEVIATPSVDAADAVDAKQTAKSRPDARGRKPDPEPAETDPPAPAELVEDVARAREMVRTGQLGDLIEADRLGNKLERKAKDPNIRQLGILLWGMVACHNEKIWRVRNAWALLGVRRRARLAAECWNKKKIRL